MLCEISSYIFKRYKLAWALSTEIAAVVWGPAREGRITANIVSIVHTVTDPVLARFRFGWHTCLRNGGRSCRKKYCCVFTCMYKWSGGHIIFSFQKGTHFNRLDGSLYIPSFFFKFQNHLNCARDHTFTALVWSRIHWYDYLRVNISYSKKFCKIPGSFISIEWLKTLNKKWNKTVFLISFVDRVIACGVNNSFIIAKKETMIIIKNNPP